MSKNNRMNIVLYKLNNARYMIKEKNKKNNKDKRKSCKKKRWEIGKLKIKTKEKKIRKNIRDNWITYLFKRSRKKSLWKRNKWEGEDKKKDRDSSMSWLKINKTKRNFGKKLKDKD